MFAELRPITDVLIANTWTPVHVLQLQSSISGNQAGISISDSYTRDQNGSNDHSRND